MSTRHILLLALGIAASGQLVSSRVQAQTGVPAIFRFETDEFWLNLHHFLYVLGRAQNRDALAAREAVVGAPAESDSGLARLSDAERSAWRQAVEFYATGPSRKDVVFDAPLPAVAGALAAARDAHSLAGLTIDTSLARTLELAAPAYRKAWWPAHRRANVSAQQEFERQVAQHGAAILAFITKVYGMTWPSDGFPVHLSGYSNWAGAYSTDGNLLVVASLAGDKGIETLFHEGMHQWDSAVFQLLRVHSRALGGLVPNGLSHALIFFTAGEATRRVIPGYTPYADRAGIWDRGLAQFREPLNAVWKPYLDGKGTRDEALAELVRRTLVRR